MQPGDLRADNFSKYPEKARALAIASLPVLRRIPLSLLPLVLGQIINYDWRFPAEQRELAQQLRYLEGLSPADFTSLMAPFASIGLTPELAAIDWVNQPRVFSNQLSTFLWSVHKIDGYHAAAQQYQQQLLEALVPEPPTIPRFTIAIVGQGVGQTDLPLFRRLRPHGTLFTHVSPESGLQTLLDVVKSRAQQHPEPFAHWYIDGGEPEPTLGPDSGVTVTSYAKLTPAVMREFTLMNQFVARSSRTGQIGPEAMTSYVASMTPEDLKIGRNPHDPVLEHFEVALLTEGAGTQIFSTTFVQWAARECLHRAQPLTLFARFKPRQRAASMNQLLSRDPSAQPADTEGSLVDADMGAYYTWINQERLPGAEQSRFLAWFEDHNLAIGIGPTLAQDTTSDEPADMKRILGWM